MTPDMLHGKRLVLFGAGRVAQEFFSYFSGLNVVAFSDNDRSKQGRDINGVRVIAPEEIVSLEFDLVLITTGWWKSISKQLQGLGVPVEKIMLPPKSLLAINHGRHPFSHPKTKAFATLVMQCIADTIISRGVRICLDFGTLLGACRDGDFIPWDDDVDLVLTEDDFPCLLSSLPELKAALPITPEIVVDVSIISFSDRPVAVVITFLNAPGCDGIVPFEIGILQRVFEGGYFVTKGCGTEFIAPEIHFRSYDQISFLERTFSVPHQAESYLEFLYGDWRVPKENTTLADYPTQEPEYTGPVRVLL